MTTLRDPSFDCECTDCDDGDPCAMDCDRDDECIGCKEARLDAEELNAEPK